MTQRTPNVFVIGAGRMAGALAGALRKGGVPVLGLWGRRPQAARAAGAAAGVAAFSAAPPDLLLEADVVILAVRDDAIAEVAQLLVQSGFITRRHVLVQCGGARRAAEVFGTVSAALGGIATMHPLRSIAAAKSAILKGTVFGIEGDPTGVAMARELVRLLGGTPLDLASGNMALYHVAASIASNHLVALLDAAGEVLAAATESMGADAPDLAALLPLVSGTLENLALVLAQGWDTSHALTGPIARGDLATVERHLGALSERLPALLPMYCSVGLRAVAIARRKGEATKDSLDRIEEALAARG